MHSSSVNAVFHRDAKGLTPSRPPTTRDPFDSGIFPEAAALRTFSKKSEKQRRQETPASHCTKIMYSQRNVTISILRMQYEILRDIPKKKEFNLNIQVADE